MLPARTPVKGWLGPGMGEVEGTLEVLRSCGIEYVCDWGPADDQPFQMKNGLYVSPYAIDLNDMSIDRHGTSAGKILRVHSGCVRRSSARGEDQGRVLEFRCIRSSWERRTALVILKRHLSTSAATPTRGLPAEPTVSMRTASPLATR